MAFKRINAASQTERMAETMVQSETTSEQVSHDDETSHDENCLGRVLGEGNRAVRKMGTATTPLEKARAFYDNRYGNREVETIEEPDFFDVEERLSNPCHPLHYLCGGCQEIIQQLERGAFALKYQPIFHFFSEDQLSKLEDYFTGEDRESMKLPAPNARPQQQPSNNRGGLPFLKAIHLDENPRVATILATQFDEDNQFGAQVIVKLSFGPQRTFKWGLRVGGKKENPNYGVLVDKFGDDTENWNNQKIQLANRKDDFNEQEWPTVVGFGEIEHAAKPKPRS